MIGRIPGFALSALIAFSADNAALTASVVRAAATPGPLEPQLSVALRDLDLARGIFAAASDGADRTVVRDIDAAIDDLRGAGGTDVRDRGAAGAAGPQAGLDLLRAAKRSLASDESVSATRDFVAALGHIDLAAGTIEARLEPERVSVATDGAGTRHFAAGGRPFAPMCANVLTEVLTPYKTFDMFDTRTFDRRTIDREMAVTSADGFDCVRVWLKGIDTDDGFAASPGGDYDPAVWDKYVANVDATIASARERGLRVILTGSFPGPNPSAPAFVPKNYLPPPASLPSTAAVGGINRLLLVPAIGDRLGSFYRDLFVALRKRDPNVTDDVFYFDLYNELHYDLREAPFATMSGTYAYGGRTYDLGDPGSRQALMDRATRRLIATLGDALDEAAPGVLVSASTGFNSPLGHTHFDGGVPNRKDPDGLMVRPFSLLAGGADLVDIHVYPGPAIPEDKLPPFHDRAAAALASDGIRRPGDGPSDESVSVRDAPLFAGEFGTEFAKYGVTADPASPLFAEQYRAGLERAIAEMRATERTAFCADGFAGYAIWELGLHGAGAAGTFNIVSPDDRSGRFLHAFSPKFAAYCGS